MCSLYLGENLISGSKPINLGVRNIGELVYSSLPLTDAGLHLLDGSLILGGGIYQGFVDYIADLYGDGTSIPSYFCTESEWQTAVTTYGVCGKFVYDSTNNTVRLPKITGIIEGTTDVTALGDLVEAGLPNHRHIMFQTFGNNTAITTTSYVATGRDTGGNAGYVMGQKTNGEEPSLGKSGLVIESNIYGNSTTVQPQTIKVLYYIVVATSTKTDIQVDIDEVVTDLNGKADVDLSNVTDTGYIKMAGASMPSNRYIDLTLGASGTTYTAPANGWVIVGKRCTANQYLGTYSNTIMKCLETWDSGYCSLYFPVKKGDTFPISYTAAGKTEVFRFIYAQGSTSEVN